MLLHSWIHKLVNPTSRSRVRTERRHGQSQRPKRGTTLGVEALEDRLAPATLTVLNNNPWGVGSLQQAVLNSGSGDTIIFAPSLAGQTITLAVEVDFMHNLTIVGLGADQLSVSGNNATRIL